MPQKTKRKITKFLIWLSYLMRVTLVVAMFLSALSAQWLLVFVSSLAFILSFTPSWLERSYKIHLPTELELALFFFVYAALYLGEVSGYYARFWWWDTLLHASAGLALGMIGFLILFMLSDRKSLRASPRIIAVFAFCFALALGAVWEIFEFSMDSLIGTNMQKSGLADTMWDLIFDASGALAIVIVMYPYVKYGKQGAFSNMILNFELNNPRLFQFRKK